MSRPAVNISAMSARRRPVFDIVQPDGVAISIDFTTPGAFGDFAFAVTYPDHSTVRYGAYHTAEASVFLDVLRCWAATTSPADIAAELEAIPAHLAALTQGMQPSSRSQNHFDDLMLDHVRVAATAENPAPTSYTIDSVSPGRLALTPTPTSLRFAIVGDDDDRYAPIEIPAVRLPTVIVGMIWRSYSEGAITLTRLSTDTYEAALAAFSEGVDAAR